MLRSGWKLLAVAAAAGAGLVWAGDLPRPAPPLALVGPDGQKVTLESRRGKVVLLEFLLTD